MDRRQLEKIKEVVSIVAAIMTSGERIVPDGPVHVDMLDRRAAEIEHRLDLVLQHRAGLEELYR